jgi:hypothetical protein
MSFRYIKNHKDHLATKCESIADLDLKTPEFKNKVEFLTWCGQKDTNYAFFSLCEGDSPNLRVTKENPIFKVHGIVADYDASHDPEKTEEMIAMACKEYRPTWISESFSGYARLVWLFPRGYPVPQESYEAFYKRIGAKIGAERVFPGFDTASYNSTQYFAAGTNWRKIGEPLDEDVVVGALFQAVQESPPTTAEAIIPMDVIYDELHRMYKEKINCSKEEFGVGTRLFVFDVEPFEERTGCIVLEHGVYYFSTRSIQEFKSWKEILGAEFVREYEEEKLKRVLDNYWYNGTLYFKLGDGKAEKITKDQLNLELKMLGYSPKIKKNTYVSELEIAINSINNKNRVDAIAPVIFSNERIVRYKNKRILNEGKLKILPAADNGDPENWPWLNNFFNQLFAKNCSVDQKEVWYSWLHVARLALKVGDVSTMQQGHAMIWCGGAGVGKSLTSGGIASPLLGGSTNASQYLSGKTSFNKDLANYALWTIDDTVSAASFSDQRKAEEILKAAVANRYMNYHAKYADSLEIPISPRVFITLNQDPASLSVIPSLDQSNRDKIIALRIAESAMIDFPENLSAIIKKELPYFAKFIEDWEIPEHLKGTTRFGMKNYIDDVISKAAYDNSRRSHVAEMVEWLVQEHRKFEFETSDEEGPKFLVDTLTGLQSMIIRYNEGKHLAVSHDLYAMGQGLQTMEEQCRIDKTLRPIYSTGSGGGTYWEICLDEEYDIKPNTSKNKRRLIK